MPDDRIQQSDGTVLAIIAGAGRFPFLVAQEAKRQGRSVIAVGIKGWADPALASHVDAYEELEVGALSTLIERLNAQGARQAIMAGKVTKQVLLDSSTTFDAQLRAAFGNLKTFSVNALLGQIGKWLANQGITLLDSSTFLKAFLCPEGVVTTRPPTANEREDVEYGRQVALTVASLDIGQTIVVKRQVVVAVEALEGTDAAVRRAHEVAGGDLVVVKLASPAQDMRFDLPVLGRDSMEVFAASGVSCVAVQAQQTLLLEKDQLLASANAANLCLIGLS